MMLNTWHILPLWQVMHGAYLDNHYKKKQSSWELNNNNSTACLAVEKEFCDLATATYI